MTMNTTTIFAALAGSHDYEPIADASGLPQYAGTQQALADAAANGLAEWLIVEVQDEPYERRVLARGWYDAAEPTDGETPEEFAARLFAAAAEGARMTTTYHWATDAASGHRRCPRHAAVPGRSLRAKR